MELLDWTLRCLSPDGETLAWHAENNRSPSELHDGRPTRALRMAYAVREQPEKRAAAELYRKTIQELAGVIQGSKHSTEKVLACVALTVEGVISFLLVD